ncbi:MAG: NFACT RNA binding domain-containing protein [Acutalibacteraceae bacterium]|nr:NFACT RNA binding domain-containing protein [Acutalibacteraceae bacterium]
MALDGIYLNFLVSEVNELLAGAKVDKIHQPSKNELVFIMRTRGGMHKLYFSADANSPRFAVVNSVPENPQTPPMLCMLFRKRLVGATLLNVEQYGLDRIAFFNFDATNEIGDRVKLTLAVEIMAQHSNVILFDSDNRIVDALRRVDSEKSSYRLVLPGAQYKLPPPQDKLDIRSVEPQEICQGVLTLANSKLSSAILKTMQGVSPLLSREIAYRVCGDDKGVGELTTEEKMALLCEISSLKTMVLSGETKPTMVLDESEKPMEFSFMPITQYGGAYRVITKNDVFELLEGFYSERDRVLRTRSKGAELFKLLDNAIERTSRKLNNQQEDLRKCADREDLRIKAELITAVQYKLEKGASVYEVENYYDNNNIVKISVDPALSPSQNSQKLYKEYRKACTAENMLIKLIEEGEQDLEYLKSVKDLLERSTLEREFSEIKDELISQGFIKPKKSNKKQMKKQALPPLEFKTSQGLTVLVGRNNIQNDKLTFKVGRKGDMWLHAQKCPGSHVLLLSEGSEIPDDAIVEAAEIAAFYSSAKDGTIVTVDYTDVKNIKKPNGAKPGFVVYYTYYSVNVKPKDYNF